LGRDLAESLGTAAVMSALVRTAIGPWTVDTAVDPRVLTATDWQARLDPLRKAVAALPARELTSAELARVRRGLFIPVTAADAGREIAAVDASGQLVAILVPRAPGQWGAAKNFEL
jgi:tRNA U55 pseudouridine synthase TruB